MSSVRGKFFLWLGLGLVAIIVGALAWSYFKKEKVTPPTEVLLKRGDLETSIVASGDVKPENRLEIKSPLTGRIDQVLVQEGQKVKAGQVLAWISSTERAALLDAARAKGPEELKYWESLYRPIPIVAPLAGTIILRDIEAGQTFDSGKVIFVMSDRLLVKAQVDETDLSKIRLKQSTRVVLDAYPREPMTGHVHKISYESKVVNNVTTYTIDVLTDQIPDFMRSGMTANVSFVLDSKKDVLLVPVAALNERGDTTFVVLKKPNREPVEQLIQIGLSDGKNAEVVSGVQEGDRVLIPSLSESSGGKDRNPFGFTPPRRGPRR